jgi:hypothetical protein
VSRTAAAAAAALLAVSCTRVASSAASSPGPSGRPAPSPASSFVIPSPILSPRPFTAEDLASVVLGRGDRPRGTEFASAFSTDQTIDQFASDSEELTELRQDRFVLGHVSLFVPTGQLDHDAPPAEPGAIFVQCIAGVFETAAGADTSLRRYVANLRAFQLRSEVRIAAGGLGDSSEGLHGRSDGEDVTVYAWRTANLLLVVSGSGTIAPEAVRALADLVQHRAERAR